MSDILVADAFGYLKDGTHVVSTDQGIIGASYGGMGCITGFRGNFTITDIGDGRKWLAGTNAVIGMSTLFFVYPYPQRMSACIRWYRGGAGDQNLFKFYDWAMGKLGSVVWDSSTNNLIYQIGSTELSYDQPRSWGPAIPYQTEVFIEVEVYFHSTAGWVKWYLNGEFQSETTGIDTTRSNSVNCATVNFFPGYLTPSTNKFTDLLVHRGTAPIGDVKCYYAPMDTPGSDSDFTPSAGDNEDNVDEIGTDEDTTYNESDGTSGHRDSFKGSIPQGIVIKSVGALVRARKNGVGPGALQVGVKHGGSEDLSYARGLSPDYMNFIHFVDDNPSTSAAWTEAELAAAELVYEVD